MEINSHNKELMMQLSDGLKPLYGVLKISCPGVFDDFL